MDHRFNSHQRSAALAALLLTLNLPQADAIEAPKPAAPPPPQQPQQERPDIVPTDETQFFEVLQRVSQSRDLRGLNVDKETIQQLARGDADQAVAKLGSQAGQGNREANIALVRLQHWCNTVSSARQQDPKAQIAKLPIDFPAERAARAAGVINAQAKFLEHARAGCNKAGFDYQGIEARLREAAEAGHPASATELAQFVRDPAKREALLKSARDRNYAPATYAAATRLLIAVQSGQTTENVSAIRELLKQAGRAIPKAKLDLANCMALGCDGHPADARTAQAFGLDAARDGEPLAYLSMMRMPWGQRLGRVQLLAWQYFGDRLNEAGCLGAEAYIPSSMGFAQSIPLLERGQDSKVLTEAKSQADTLWQQNGERAKKENGCN